MYVWHPKFVYVTYLLLVPSYGSKISRKRTPQQKAEPGVREFDPTRNLKVTELALGPLSYAGFCMNRNNNRHKVNE